MPTLEEDRTPTDPDAPFGRKSDGTPKVGLARKRGKFNFEVQVLRPKHLKALGWRINDGWTYGKIAKKLGHSEQTVQRWFKSPLIKREHQRLLAGEPETVLSEADEKVTKLNAADKERREKGLEDFWYFATEILHLKGFLERKIHGPLCDLLQNYHENIAVSAMMPRCWGKSLVCSIAYPIWRAMRDPDIEIMIVQNTIVNARKKLGAIRSQFESNEMLRRLYPERMQTPQCTWGADSLVIPRPGHHSVGTFDCSGVGTAVVSRHYNIIIEDDTAAPDISDLGNADGALMPSSNQMDQAIDWHSKVLPLLHDIRRDQIIVVGTRWWEIDLLVEVRADPNYKNFEKAALEKNGVSDPDGEPTWPERYDRTVLARLKDSLGLYMFAALYLNNPTPTGDMNFQKEWLKEKYDEAAFEKLSQTAKFKFYTTVDPANDPTMTKGTTDYNVVMTAAKDMETGHIYVRKYSREKCGPTRLIELLFQHMEEFNPSEVGVESIGYQRTLLTPIAEEMAARGKYWKISALHLNQSSKEGRIMGLQPMCAAGKLHIKAEHSALENELVAFPRGKNDDVIDALSMQLGMWGITWGRKAKAPEKRDNPLLLENYIARMRSDIKREGRTRNPVLDVMRRGRTLRR